VKNLIIFSMFSFISYLLVILRAFKIEDKDPDSKARAGIITTPHGFIHTPAFVNVATKATVKALSPEEVRQTGGKVILANTYHLYLEPGDEEIKKMGGLHKVMNWKGPLMTDSGGFQVFSLGAALGRGISKILRKNEELLLPEADLDLEEPEKEAVRAKIDSDGVTFRSHIDGSAHYFTPEKSIDIQHNLGADIIFAFDECTSPHESLHYQKEALERTHRWAKRSLEHHQSLIRANGRIDGPALFGIVQGGRDEALRKESDVGSKERLAKIEAELAEINETLTSMKGHWTLERDIIQKIRTIKSGIDEARVAEQQAERQGDLSKVAEIRYGKIVELEKQLGAENAHLAEIQQDRKMLKEEVDEEDVAQVVAKWTGIPVDRLLSGEKEKLVHADTELARRVVGQTEAITAVANAVRRARAGLQDPNRPLGSFIFLGPTGVGKTELARSLAHFLFDTEKAMIRIDMSEFMEKHSVSRLIGAPPGYVGYEEGGYLTEAVRRRPYSVILFDEIEKAHPDVFNVLLQILDDGRLTDGKGRTVDFKNTILIMTSNLGSQMIMEMGEGRRAEMQTQIDAILHAQFRPEFLNRIDEIIIFHSLGKEHLARIIDIQVELLIQRLAEQKYSISLTEAAKEYLIEVGYDPSFGARPLKRAIQRYVQDGLAMKILDGTFGEGDTIVVDRGEAGLTFGRGVTASG